MATPTLYCRYTDILFSAVWSLTAGAANSAFPLTNLNNVYPGVVSKLTGTSGTYRGTIASTAIQAIALINCNLAGLTIVITNNGGMASQNLVVPAAAVDNLSLNALIDLRAVTTAGTQWNLAIPANSSNVAIGQILLISSLRSMIISWAPKIIEVKPRIVKRTASGQAVGYPKGVRYRGIKFNVYLESERANYTSLRRTSNGPSQPVVFLLDSAVNDPMYSWFPNDSWEHERQNPGFSPIDDSFEEMNPGVVLS